MLKGLHPLLDADLLGVLASMGHGDELAVVDANFPAASTARRLVRSPAASATGLVQAVLTLMPLDDFVDAPATRMAVVGDETSIPPVCRAFQVALDAAEARGIAMDVVDRATFYERARQAFAVVQTGEDRLYGCLLLRMGVIRPDAALT